MTEISLTPLDAAILEIKTGFASGVGSNPDSASCEGWSSKVAMGRSVNPKLVKALTQLWKCPQLSLTGGYEFLSVFYNRVEEKEQIHICIW